jgi:hypothetical protein
LSKNHKTHFPLIPTKLLYNPFSSPPTFYIKFFPKTLHNPNYKDSSYHSRNIEGLERDFLVPLVLPGILNIGIPPAIKNLIPNSILFSLYKTLFALPIITYKNIHNPKQSQSLIYTQKNYMFYAVIKIPT